MHKNQNHFDVIIIGSGIGGLTSAAILARYNHKKVLVLEKHFQLGGLTHEFQRGKFRWDVGLHYVGGVAKGDFARAVFDYITNSKLEWQKMPFIFEKFIYPDLKFDVPSDPIAYRKKLIEQFPLEKFAIIQYFKDIQAACSWQRLEILAKGLPTLFAKGLKICNFRNNRLARGTVGDYLDSHFKDKRLIALLASQWGDYGLPPHQAAFAIHAIVVQYYLQGAYYPIGGASSIVKQVQPIIENDGGRLLPNQEVTDLIIEEGIVKGVKTRYASYYAPIVISNMGAVETYHKLLKNHLPLPRDMNVLPNGLSAVTAYVGLKKIRKPWV